MRLPQVRFTVRRMMVVVAVSAYSLAVAAQALRQPEMAREPVGFPLALFAVGAFGVAVVRHPWFSLPVVILLLGYEQRGGGFGSLQVFQLGCSVAWFVGAPTGWLARYVEKRWNSSEGGARFTTPPIVSAIRLLRVRFTIRRMMAAVAVFAGFTLIYRAILTVPDEALLVTVALWVLAPVAIPTVVVHLPLPVARRLGQGAGRLIAVAVVVAVLSVPASVFLGVLSQSAQEYPLALLAVPMCIALAWLCSGFLIGYGLAAVGRNRDV